MNEEKPSVGVCKSVKENESIELSVVEKKDDVACEENESEESGEEMEKRQRGCCVIEADVESTTESLTAKGTTEEKENENENAEESVDGEMGSGVGELYSHIRTDDKKEETLLSQEASVKPATENPPTKSRMEASQFLPQSSIIQSSTEAFKVIRTVNGLNFLYNATSNASSRSISVSVKKTGYYRDPIMQRQKGVVTFGVHFNEYGFSVTVRKTQTMGEAITKALTVSSFTESDS